MALPKVTKIIRLTSQIPSEVFLWTDSNLTYEITWWVRRGADIVIIVVTRANIPIKARNDLYDMIIALNSVNPGR